MGSFCPAVHRGRAEQEGTRGSKPIHSQEQDRREARESGGVRRKGEGHRVAVRTFWLQEGFVEALTKLTLDGCQLHSTDVVGAANTGRARRDQGAALCALSRCSPAVQGPDTQTVRPG